MNVIPKFDALAKMIAGFEGFRSKAYRDSGSIFTIGFGSTYNYKEKRKVKEGDEVTFAEAANWLQFEFQEVVRQLNHYITKPLSWHQSTALCSYVYNRGIGNFLKTNLDELINTNPNDPKIPAVIEGSGLKDRMGNLLRGLVRRRRIEARLYQNGTLKF